MDFERLKKTFEDFELEHEIETVDSLTYITCKAREHQNVEGYIGFEASFVFDEDGQFLTLNIFE